MATTSGSEEELKEKEQAPSRFCFLVSKSVIATNPHSTKHNDGKANGSTTQPGIFMTRILLNRFMKTACINAGMVAFVLITLKSSHVRFKFI
ncbi:hypothetical protein M513_11248 [Trichuris suis]|uniref:Uncharacterized protein n=1 Tax=Trichuris suis TaxID=68888 RepID=A0A085LSE9_9BILA|nr:hypothetical protein M513_11248 [Trichuris suis]